MSAPVPFHQYPFTNSFVEQLPGETAPHTGARQVKGVLYSLLSPTPVAAPRLLAWSDEMGELLGVTRPDVTGPDGDALAGNLVTATMRPFAARYGGHQFGSWAGQLGDGRAIALGELHDSNGRPWEVQLKGAGPTTYSRAGDGRAVLRSSVREFLCSEAMHHVGVPTTRALSLVTTGDQVVRDMFYSGNPLPEPGAIVARVAPSFVRFGNFQILAAQNETENLRTLAHYVIRRDYSELGDLESGGEAVYAAWYREICRRTAVMMAHWMSVGFVHGVMNTDNMSILGLTIDYGPYGWLEPYDPNWTPNTTDFGQRRYAYGQQAHIGQWNLAMLAQALVPLIPTIPELEAGLELYRTTYLETRQNMLLAKLGLAHAPAEPEAEDRPHLLQDLHAVLAAGAIDMTRFFRTLCQLAPRLATGDLAAAQASDLLVQDAAYPEAESHEPLAEWLASYQTQLQQEARQPGSIKDQMLAANPKYVLRNYLAQQVIEAATAGDSGPLERLFQVLKTPYAEQPEHEELSALRPEWARTRPGCATLSCSS